MNVSQTGALTDVNATAVTDLTTVNSGAVTDLTGPVIATVPPPINPADPENLESWHAVPSPPEAWETGPDGQCPPTTVVLKATEEGLVSTAVAPTAQVVAPSYVVVLSGANVTTVEKAKRKRSNKDRILRSKNYEKSALAKVKPVTEEELATTVSPTNTVGSITPGESPT